MTKRDLSLGVLLLSNMIAARFMASATQVAPFIKLLGGAFLGTVACSALIRSALC